MARARRDCRPLRRQVAVGQRQGRNLQQPGGQQTCAPALPQGMGDQAVVNHAVNTKGTKMIYTRRDFGKLALTALPAARLLAMPQAKPDSKFGGVQIGMIAPYSFRGLPSSADDLLKYLVQLGVNSVELQSEPVETYAGAPAPKNCANGACLRRSTSPKSYARTTTPQA